jgi:hypothetical protein
MDDKKLKILFLCTGNACRSQMAEGWTRHLKGDAIEVFSAGVETHGVDPKAVAVMKIVGIIYGGTFEVNYATMSGNILAFNYRTIYWREDERKAFHQKFIRDHYLKQFNEETIRRKQQKTAPGSGQRKRASHASGTDAGQSRHMPVSPGRI